MLTRFQVKNYKCLKDVDLALTPVHVLIGQNDSGKSSLLEAMYALFRIGEPDAKLLDGFPSEWTGRELVYHGAAEPVIELGGTAFDPAKHDDRISIYKIILKFGGQEPNAQAKEGFSGRSAIEVVKREQSAQFNPKLFAGVEMYRFNPHRMAVPTYVDAAGADDAERFKLHHDGFGLASLLDDILGYDFELYGRLRDAFRSYFPHFINIRLEKRPDAYRRQRTDFNVDQFSKTPGKEIHLVTKDGSIRLRQASDGAILLLGYLALCHVPNPPRLLLIEEPEDGIYPKRLTEVVRLLKQFASDQPMTAPQIVLTTHSPYLLSEFEPEEVTFLGRQPDGSVRARSLSEAPRIKERLGEDFEYLGELWYNYDEEVLFGDGQPVPGP